MTQLIDGDKLIEDMRKVVYYDYSDINDYDNALTESITKQTAELTREQFLAECRELGCKVTEIPRNFSFYEPHALIEIKDFVFKLNYDREAIYMQCKDYKITSYRKALVLIQALLQVEGGA